MKVYNAENQILGRLASVVAKQLIKGEKVAIVNAEKAVLSGNPKSKIEEYKVKRERGDPIHGPFFPRQPDAILRRTIRGMLPWDRPSGRKVYMNLKVYTDMPEELKGKTLEQIKEAEAGKGKFITLGEISLAIGGKKVW